MEVDGWVGLAGPCDDAGPKNVFLVFDIQNEDWE